MKRTVWTSLCLGAALAVAAMVPQGAWAASVDINGQVVDEGVKIIKGTTMIDQDNLRDVLMLDVNVEKKAFTLTNDDKTVTIEGAVGKKNVLVNGDKVTMTVPASLTEDTLWLPLRPLMETFGQVEWDAENDRVRATFDYTRFNNLPNAKRAKAPIPYEIVVNSGVGAQGENDVPINVDMDGLGILAEVYEEGMLLSVNNGGGAVIAPVHEGYQLHALSAQNNGYAYDSKAFCWQEVPQGASTAQDRQYLYIQPRQEGAAPICLEEGTLDAAVGTVLSDVAYHDGKVVWSTIDQKRRQWTLKCYDLDSQKTRILDEVKLARLAKGATYDTHVTVGGDVAACMVAAPSDENVYMGTVMCYDLGDKVEKTVIGRGYNLMMPEIYGDHMLVVAAEGPSNVMAASSSTGETALWCYDLRNNKWCYKVPASLVETDKKSCRQGVPMRLDANHAAPDVLDVKKPYALTILDVAEGVLATTEDSEGKALQYVPKSLGEAAIGREADRMFHSFNPCQGDHISYGRTYVNDGGITHDMLYAIDFNW